MNSFLKKIRIITFGNFFLKFLYFLISGRKIVERKIIWMDEYEKLEHLKNQEKCFLSTPKLNGINKLFYTKVPDVYISSLKNVFGALNSSSFYSEEFAVIERFRWIDQNIANYADGHLILHDNLIAVFKCKKREIIFENRNTLFLGGNGSYNYFHWMIEILPKLLILNKSIVDKLNIECIVVNGLVKEVDNFRIPLEILGEKLNIQIVFYNQEDSIKFKNLFYITTFNHVLFNIKGEVGENQCYFSKEILLELSKIFISYASSSNVVNKKFPQKIFIRRGGGVCGYNKRNYNENEIIDVVKKFEIECIYIEDYSFIEQVQLFSNAELVVAPSGAFFTNLIFCKKDTVIISWLTPQVSNFSVYSTLSYLFNLDMKFILANQLQSEDIHGEYYLNPTELDNILGGILVGMKDEMKETN